MMFAKILKSLLFSSLILAIALAVQPSFAMEGQIDDDQNSHQASLTWIINPSEIPSFDEDKQKWLAEALSKSQVKVIYNNDLKTEASDPIPFRPQSLTTLVTGKHVSIYLILPGLEELHVGLVVKDMLALKGEALQEFRKMLQNVAYSFQALGYGRLSRLL